MKINNKIKNRIKERLDDMKVDIGLQILELRILKNITQEKLAALIGTQQPGIARAERGVVTPSITFLNKIATVLDTELIPPKFAAVEENEMNYKNKSVLSSRSTPTKFYSSLTVISNTNYHLSSALIQKESILTLKT